MYPSQQTSHSSMKSSKIIGSSQPKIIDLTHPLTPEIPTWSGSCGFCLEIKKDYDRQFRVHQMKMHAGAGTHMDAPSHRFQGGASIADIPLEQLIVPLCILDVRDRMEPDYAISVDDLEKYEREFGSVPENALVIGHTGWNQFWSNPTAYRNVDSQGQMHFPAFSSSLAQKLLQRNIAGIAIDTLSPDCLDQTFPVHQLILGANKYIIENVADCSKMPPQGGYAIALPLRADKATESPIRLIGLIPQ